MGADAAFGPGDGTTGGLDGVGGGVTGGAAHEDRRQQAAEAVAARLRQEVEPVTRALAGVQVWLQELANQQARLVQQHDQQQQQQEDKQQQQQDPSRRPDRVANGMSQDDVTQLRQLPVAVALAVQQQLARRDLVTGAMLGAAVVLGYGLGWRVGSGPGAPACHRPHGAPATDPTRGTPTSTRGGAVGEGTALSGTGSNGNGSGLVAPGEGGAGPVKYKAPAESGGAGRVFVPPRATTTDEKELLKQCNRARPDMDVVRQLLAAGTAVNVSDGDGTSPLGHAARWDHVELVELLLAAGANPRCCDKHGFTPLHVAKSRLAVEVLVGAGAPLEARTHRDDFTPLHTRVMHGYVEAAEALIRAGADISARYPPGKTALHLAARRGQYEAARLLLRYGADVDAKDGNGDTPLMRAKLSFDIPTISLLRKAEAEAEATRKAEAQAKAGKKAEAEGTA